MKLGLYCSICFVFSGHALCAQTTVSKWEWNATATVHPPLQIKQSLGEDKIQIRPSSGWEFGLAYEIFASEKYKLDIGYCRGSTPVFFLVDVDKNVYPQLEQDYKFKFYYLQHSYNSFFFRTRRSIDENIEIGLEIANRFYRESGASSRIEANNSIDSSNLIVLKARTQTSNSRYFSPHLKLSFTGTIWKRFPSFLYETSICYAPISVIDGSFVLFPNDTNYTSSGTFRVQQSYLGLGIKYRQVKKKT
jgi:hypothetical protein